MFVILIPTLIILVLLGGTLCTYLIRNRNSSLLGWLVNLSLITLLILLVQLISIYNNVTLGIIVGVIIAAVGLIIFLGLTLSFIFLFANALIVWQRENHSLSSSLTLIAGIGVILVDIFVFFNPFRTPTPLQTFIIAFLTMVIVYVLLTVWNTITSMIVYHWYFPKKDKDYIIVLGSGLVDGYKVGRLLGNRINKAIDFYHEQLQSTHKRAKLLFSGGQGSDEKLPEGVAMQKYAIEHGIPKADTLVEAQSVNTDQNMRFSEKVIENDGGSKDSKKIFVTNNFHTLRAGILAHKQKIQAYGLGAKTPFYYLPNAVIREYLALFVMHKRFHITMLILMFALSVILGIGAFFVPAR
ncbi:membrane protein [Lentilactobacillus fungorum]|uniref:Membrane protein n=1 Tax=Lentilactobacillus fungorum TaxID=2201250 RepID=A0ABQ3W0T7_9LACO|nr:YdcF family protein [Lentilactobacillus fungorum]GHP13886.1 membrane protein [Lentilactobacillus fungorum]